MMSSTNSWLKEISAIYRLFCRYFGDLSNSDRYFDHYCFLFRICQNVKNLLAGGFKLAQKLGFVHTVSITN